MISLCRTTQRNPNDRFGFKFTTKVCPGDSFCPLKVNSGDKLGTKL